MGLGDEVSKAAADEFLSGRRARRARREQFRDELLGLLTEYGTLIEHVRQGYLRVLEAVRNGSPIGEIEGASMRRASMNIGDLDRMRWPAGEVEVGTVTWDKWIEDESLDQMVAATDDAVLDHRRPISEGERRLALIVRDYLRHAGPDRRPWTSGSSRDLRRDSVGESAGIVAIRAIGALRTAEELDQAWGDLRPRLDDALGSVAVSFLREIRHELKAEASMLDSTIALFVGGRPVSGDTVVAAVEEFLVRADAWAAAITETRNAVRGRAAL